MFENIVVLLLILILTFTAKNNNIGVLVSCYYAAYICLDLSYFGLIPDFTMLTFDRFSLWYLICFFLTLVVYVFSVTLFAEGDNVAGLYAIWLLLCLSLDGASSVFQLLETNNLLIVYNVIQSISVCVDLFVVFVGMDHVIKRKHIGAGLFIVSINNYIKHWRFISFLLFCEGAKCNPKS